MRILDRRKYRPEQIEIDHHEPLVVNKSSRGEWFRLLGELQVGDSFFISAPTFRDVESARNTVYDAIRRSHLSVRIVTRQVEGGIRVWRVPDDYTSGPYITGDVEELRERAKKKNRPRKGA